jgi:hypothetical protein
MPSYFTENNEARPSDDAQRSLQKINNIVGATGVSAMQVSLATKLDSTNDSVDSHTNKELSAFVSQARTTTSSSADLANNGCAGCVVVVDATAHSATPSVTFKVQGKDPLSGKYYDILTSAAVTASPSTVMLKVYPGLTAAANLVVSDVLPKTFRVTATHGDADSITYSVGVLLVR